MRSDEGGDFTGEVFKDVCRRDCIERELTTADSPLFNEVTERVLSIETTAKAATVPDFADTDFLWAKVML